MHYYEFVLDRQETVGNSSYSFSLHEFLPGTITGVDLANRNNSYIHLAMGHTSSRSAKLYARVYIFKSGEFLNMTNDVHFNTKFMTTI